MMEVLAALHAALVAGRAFGREVARSQTMVTNVIIDDESKPFPQFHFVELFVYLVFKAELVSPSDEIFNLHSGSILSKRRFELLEREYN